MLNIGMSKVYTQKVSNITNYIRYD